MTLLAFGAATDSDAIVGVDLDDDGSLVVTIELPIGEETHTLPARSVSPEVRAALRSMQERAA